jgi:hypothetical protein
VQVLQKAWSLLSDDVKAILRSAESSLEVLNTVDLGLKRPFGVGENALWARLTGLQFAAQVAAVVNQAEAPASHRMATTVAKEVMAIKIWQHDGPFDQKVLRDALHRQTPQAHFKGHQGGGGRGGSYNRRSHSRGRLKKGQSPYYSLHVLTRAQRTRVHYSHIIGFCAVWVCMFEFEFY